MKKLNVLLAAAIITLFALTPDKLLAQDSKVLVGAGFGYATEIDSPAIFANGVYLINEKWEASVGVNYYFPKDEGPYEIEWLGFDLDAHYVFSKTEKLDVYGIAGLNILLVSIPEFDFDFGDYDIPAMGEEDYAFPIDEIPTQTSAEVNDTEIGLNLGIGARYKLGNNLFGLGEAEYVINNGGFLQVSVGVLFGF